MIVAGSDWSSTMRFFAMCTVRPRSAAESGRRVYYGTLASRLRVLTHPALVVVDEIGYLPVSRDGAVLFFQLINARHERASTVLTSNKGFEDWGTVLGDDVMAAALIDRLLHHCHIVNIHAPMVMETMILPGHQKLTHSMRGLRKIRGFHLSNDTFHLAQEAFPFPKRKSWPQRTYRRKDPGQSKSCRQHRSQKTDEFDTHASSRLLVKVS